MLERQNKNCTGSVIEAKKIFKETPYGLITKKNKQGKDIAIQLNETVDGMVDVIKEDCLSAREHGRFADDPDAKENCETALAEDAPCFNIGAINSTKVIKSRLAKKREPKSNFDLDEYYEAEAKDFNEKAKPKTKDGKTMKKRSRTKVVTTKSIPKKEYKDIYYVKEAGKTVFNISKNVFDKMKDVYKEAVKNNFYRDNIRNAWVSTSKNSQELLKKMGIPQKTKKISKGNSFNLKSESRAKVTRTTKLPLKSKKPNYSKDNSNLESRVTNLEKNQTKITNTIKVMKDDIAENKKQISFTRKLIEPKEFDYEKDIF